jgi:hypothetical protein
VSKQYDAAYFRRWYRGAQATPRAELARKVAMAVAIAEFYLAAADSAACSTSVRRGAWRARC